MIISSHHKNVLKPRISKQKRIFTWLKNVLLKPFHELFSLSCALKEIWCRKKHESKLLKPKNYFDFVHDERFSKLALSHSFPNSFTVVPDFEIRKPTFGDRALPKRRYDANPWMLVYPLMLSSEDRSKPISCFSTFEIINQTLR